MKSLWFSVKNGVLSFFRDEFFSGKPVRYAWLAAISINIIMWIFTLIKIKADYKPIPLHFNAFYGIEFVGPGFLFFELPLIGLGLLVLNLFLSRRVFRREQFLAILFSSGTAFLQLLLLIAVLNIAALNS